MPVDFAVAHARLFREGKVPDEVAHVRLAVCTGITVKGEKVGDPCPKYTDENGGWGSGHCKACGCPSWPISRMHRPGSRLPGKAWYSMACPMGKFPEHPGRRVQSRKPTGGT